MEKAFEFRLDNRDRIIVCGMVATCTGFVQAYGLFQGNIRFDGSGVVSITIGLLLIIHSIIGIYSFRRAGPEHFCRWTNRVTDTPIFLLSAKTNGADIFISSSLFQYKTYITYSNAKKHPERFGQPAQRNRRSASGTVCKIK